MNKKNIFLTTIFLVAFLAFANNAFAYNVDTHDCYASPYRAIIGADEETHIYSQVFDFVGDEAGDAKWIMLGVSDAVPVYFTIIRKTPNDTSKWYVHVYDTCKLDDGLVQHEVCKVTLTSTKTSGTCKINAIEKHNYAIQFFNGTMGGSVQIKAVIPIEYVKTTPINQTPINCSEGWQCINSTQIRYKLDDCEWGATETCEYGCENNKCNSSLILQPTCSADYKCKEDGSKGYQNENCVWTSVTGCQYGCSNGECKPAPIIPTPTITNTNYYCNGNNVWQKITYSNGTTTDNKYKECNGLCQNGNCIESNVPPTIKVLYQSPKVDVGYLASFKWNVIGNYSETGIEFGYRLNYSQMVKKVATKNSNNTYVALLSATKGNYYLFVRAYAAYNGKKVYSETRRIEIQKPVIHNVLTDSLSKWQTQIKQTLKASNTDFVVAVNEIDITKMGIDGIKFFTIGSCLDNGLWDVWCALDLSSTALLAISIFNPFDGQIPDSIAVEAKYTKLAKVGELLKTIKTGDQFADLIKSVTVIYKDRTFVKTGLDFTNLLNKSIVKIEAGEIKAVMPSLFRYALEKGDYSIMNLIGKGASKELLESAVKYGADLSKTRFITKNAKTIAWLEEGVGGTHGWGLTHIEEGHHIDEIAKALQIKTSEVQGVIKTVIETATPENSIVNTARNSFEFYKIYTVSGKQKIVQVIVSSTNIGRIVTATVVKKIPV